MAQNETIFHSPTARQKFPQWVVALGKRVSERAAQSKSRLRITREGKILLAITMAIGFAALNTGNNLLYFGWGLLLSVIMVSGVLSEATVRAVRGCIIHSGELRARENGYIEMRLENIRKRMPAFAVEFSAHITDDINAAVADAPYQLRLSAQVKKKLWAVYRPKRRGPQVLNRLEVSTFYPFGFFQKRRTRLLSKPFSLMVYPYRVDLASCRQRLFSRQGTLEMPQAGAGSEFFSLRPFRTEDDSRQIHWRRSARTGRIVVRETQIECNRDLILELSIPPDAPHEEKEYALACLGSLAEDVLAQGQAVGIRAPGVTLSPLSGPMQRQTILATLATLDESDPMPPGIEVRNATRVGLHLANWSRPGQITNTLELPILSAKEAV
jgi:uncharacterized protein (DUF58 family)